MEDISKISAEELVAITGKVIIGTGSGAQAQQAQAELTRRLTVAIKDMEKSNNNYSNRMMDLSFFVSVMTFIQIVLAVASIAKTFYQWIVGVLVICGFLYWVIHDVMKRK